MPTTVFAPPPTGKWVITPLVVMRPTRLDPVSVNQIVPCGPVVIPFGAVPAPTGNSVISSPRSVAGASISIGELILSVNRGGTFVTRAPRFVVTLPVLFESVTDNEYTSAAVPEGLS